MQCGTASWYGIPHHGRKTASGEKFNMNDMTAAHRTLPFGTKIKITNSKNSNSLVLRINDRGPFHGNRIIDVSMKAAELLGFKGRGTTEVCIEVL